MTQPIVKSSRNKRDAKDKHDEMSQKNLKINMTSLQKRFTEQIESSQMAYQSLQMVSSHKVQTTRQELQIASSHKVQTTHQELQIASSHKVQTTRQELQIASSHKVQMTRQELQIASSLNVQMTRQELQIASSHIVSDSQTPPSGQLVTKTIRAPRPPRKPNPNKSNPKPKTGSK